MLKPIPQGDGVRRWGLWEVMRSWGWSPHDGICALTRTGMRRLAVCNLSLEDTMRRWPSASQEVGPHQTLDLPAPWSWTSSSRTVTNQYLLIKPPNPQHFCYSIPSWLTYYLTGMLYPLFGLKNFDFNLFDAFSSVTLNPHSSSFSPSTSTNTLSGEINLDLLDATLIRETIRNIYLYSSSFKMNPTLGY